MKNTSFVALDFETATNNRMACQIGIVVVKDGIIVERVSKLIQPPFNQYDAGTIAVHHITPDMTEDSPTFDVVWNDIQHYFMPSFALWAVWKCALTLGRERHTATVIAVKSFRSFACMPSLSTRAIITL